MGELKSIFIMYSNAILIVLVYCTVSLSNFGFISLIHIYSFRHCNCFYFAFKFIILMWMVFWLSFREFTHDGRVLGSDETVGWFTSIQLRELFQHASLCLCIETLYVNPSIVIYTVKLWGHILKWVCDWFNYIVLNTKHYCLKAGSLCLTLKSA